ncbi:MAG: hypothetical protein AB1633_00505 [Elusimicrobiota bacterium]
MKQNLLTNAVVFILCMTFFTLVSYGVPAGINYQGRYVENDVPYNGSKTFLFELYDALTDGALLWTSGNVDLTVSNGLFNYTLNCSTVDWKNKDAYLNVTVGGTALSPRERINASAFTFYASSSAYAYDIYATISGAKMFTSSISVSGSGGLSVSYGISAGTLTFTDTQARRIDLGINASASKWIGLDSGWRMAFSDDNGFSFYDSYDKTWGTETVRLSDTGNIHPGSSSGINTSRFINDDTSNYATGFSSNVVVSGVLLPTYGPVTIIELWKEGSGGTYSLTATAGANLSNCNTVVNGTWFQPDGRVSVKLVVQVQSITGTYNFQLHNNTDDTYPVVNSDSNMSGTTTGFKESPWKDTTINGIKEMYLYGWVSSGGSVTFNPSYFLIRPRLP